MEGEKLTVEINFSPSYTKEDSEILNELEEGARE